MEERFQLDRQYSVYVEGNNLVIYPESVRWVTLESALIKARGMVKSGQYDRVFITDGGDCINFDWNAVEGITYPRAEDYESLEAKAEWDRLYPKRS